jgi:putative ABC transport system ATP-binding protein
MRIITKDLGQTYFSGDRSLPVLRDITVSIEAGEIVAFVGPSGSGKTTLLGLLAGLDRPASGSVSLDGRDLAELTDDQRAEFRARNLGFVFQSFHLLPTLTALENVRVPLELLGVDEAGMAPARQLLERVGLGDRLQHYPAQLSGGEQQRVSVARAFANVPRLLLADEPTGNLDAETGHAVIDVMLELNREFGTTLVIVTHDPELAARSDRVIRLEAGSVA